MTRSTVMYFKILPEWANSDPGIVVEKVRMTVDDVKQVIAEY